MKLNTIFFFAFFLTIFVSTIEAEAQNAERFPRLRERVVQAKLHEIKEALKLDQSAFDRFRPVYVRYEKEMTSIDFRKIGRLMKVDADSLSTDEADQLIVNQLDAAKKLILIREKYYKEFRQVLTPQQIIKLYQTEGELRKKVMQEMKRRMMNR